MSKQQIIILLGALVIVIALFSGLPTLWNTILYVIIGLSIIIVSYTLKPSTSASPKNDAIPYVDTNIPSIDNKPDQSTITPQ